MSLKNAQRTIENVVTSWEGVETHPHRFGGREFRLGTREIGHVHSDRLVDLPFPIKVRDELIVKVEAEKHHVLPDSGWGSFHIFREEDVAGAIKLFKRSYGLALEQKARRETGHASKPHRREFKQQPLKEE